MINSKEFFNHLKTVIDSYAEISDETWNEVVQASKIINVKKKDQIVTIGEMTNSIYFVVKGIFRAYVLSGLDEDKEIVKNFFDEGRFPASITSMLTNTPSNFTIEALEDSIVIDINFKSYRKILKKHDDFKWFHIQYLERHWLIEREPQEISFIGQDAKYRYEKFLTQYPGVIDRVPLFHIASRIGITPTQLSRIRKEKS